MELYKFFWGALAWIATFTILWPLNVPLIALAYKVQNGARPISLAHDEFWYRCLFGAGVLAVLSVAVILLDYFVIDITDLPAGPIHLLAFIGYVATAPYLMVISFAFTELTEGLGVFVIYIGLPLIVLLLVNAVSDLWSGPLSFAYDYLKDPK